MRLELRVVAKRMTLSSNFQNSYMMVDRYTMPLHAAHTRRAWKRFLLLHQHFVLGRATCEEVACPRWEGLSIAFHVVPNDHGHATSGNSPQLIIGTRNECCNQQCSSSDMDTPLAQGGDLLMFREGRNIMPMQPTDQHQPFERSIEF